jgi:hypothetical protein
MFCLGFQVEPFCIVLVNILVVGGLIGHTNQGGLNRRQFMFLLYAERPWWYLQRLAHRLFVQLGQSLTLKLAYTPTTTHHHKLLDQLQAA